MEFSNNRKYFTRLLNILMALRRQVDNNQEIRNTGTVPQQKNLEIVKKRKRQEKETISGFFIEIIIKIFRNAKHVTREFIL